MNLSCQIRLCGATPQNIKTFLMLFLPSHFEQFIHLTASELVYRLSTSAQQMSKNTTCLYFDNFFLFWELSPPSSRKTSFIWHMHCSITFQFLSSSRLMKIALQPRELRKTFYAFLPRARDLVAFWLRTFNQNVAGIQKRFDILYCFLSSQNLFVKIRCCYTFETQLRWRRTLSCVDGTKRKLFHSKISKTDLVR